MRAILVIFFLLSSLNTARAQESFPAGNFSALAPAGKFTVTQIIAPDTIGLSNGKIIHLTGLDFPDLWEKGEPGPLSQTALRVLNDMLLGRDVRLYQTKDRKKGRVNRMQHHIAHIESVPDGVWIQGTLISLGLARVRTTLTNREMAAQLYFLEMEARAQKLGLWSDPDYAILDESDIPADKLNRYQIIEGQVKSAALKKNRIYLNFGDDWREDFTVTISPENKKNFIKQGIDPLSWNNARLRVRGWLEFYNGANLEIDHPERVEVLKTSR